MIRAFKRVKRMKGQNRDMSLQDLHVYTGVKVGQQMLQELKAGLLALLHQQSHRVCCWIMQSCSECGHAALLIDAPCNHLRCAKKTQVVGVLSTWEGLHECSHVGSSEPLSIQFGGQLQGLAGLVYRIELRKEEVPYFAYACVKCRLFSCMAALMHVQYGRDVVYLYFCVAKFLLARLLPDSQSELGKVKATDVPHPMHACSCEGELQTIRFPASDVSLKTSLTEGTEAFCASQMMTSSP